jgi:23S rRNA (guanosine2251-2'-O)-methyltransferase
MSRQLVIIAHDIRSTHNVGALLRTAEGLGVHTVYFSGYTPYPIHAQDTRLPHLASKLDAQIHKTALGAEKDLPWTYEPDIRRLIDDLKNEDFEIIGLEQTAGSLPLDRYEPPKKVAILLGREVEGIDTELLQLCDEIVEIPMLGQKESFNVVEAATMAMFHCRFYPF